MKTLLFSACLAVLVAGAPLEAAVIYTLQDGPGTDYGSIYNTVPLDQWKANQFDALPGGERITSIGVAFGATSMIGTPVSFLLYEDVNDNGLPDDLELLASVSTTITIVNDGLGEPQLQTVILPVPQVVSGSFFVAVLAKNAPPGTRYLTDRTNGQSRSWLASNSINLGGFDPANPGAAENAPALVETLFGTPPLMADFVIQATGEANSEVPEPARISLLGGGLLVVLMARRQLAAR